MLIKNHELKDLDFLNADVLERLEDSCEKVFSQCENAAKAGRNSEGIRRQCEAIAEFIDTNFGDETAKELLGDGANLLDCIEVFGEIYKKIEEEKAEQAEKIQVLIGKYSPARIADK